MWGHSIDERKLNRGEKNEANQWHRGDVQPDAGRLHTTHPTEEVENDESPEREGTWGERDVGGFNEGEAMEQFVSESLWPWRRTLLQH